MGVRMPLPVTNNKNNQDTYDNVEEDDENDTEELQSNQSPHSHQNEEQEELVEEEEPESEEMNNQQEFNKPPKQNSPPLYPNSYQYPTFINPNMPPYSMQTPGGPLSPQFIPFNYYTAPPSPTNLQQNHVVTPKPTKKKPSNNSKKPAKDSNKQSAPIEKPNIESDSSESAKPSTPNRKDKPVVSMNPNQMYISNQPYPNGANAFLGQNQNAPILNPLNSYNTHPFNNQFSNVLPFYSNGFTPFFNYINPSIGFNGANDFPSQFGQTNPLNMYGNNPFANKNLGASPYQNNPNFNIPRNMNSQFIAYQSMNQKFNGYPQYFANPSSTGN